jgi:hypothetical protein
MTQEEYIRLFHRAHVNEVAFKRVIDCDDEIRKMVEMAIEEEREKRQWVGLTKEEAKEISLANRPYVIDMIAALEARLKEKNT